jgi:hypothetical protein
VRIASICLLALLAWAGTAEAGISATDDFDRGPDELGANWSIVTGYPEILESQDVGASGTSLATWVPDTFGNDQYSQVTITGMDTGGGAGVVCKVKSSGEYVLFIKAAIGYQANEISSGASHILIENFDTPSVVGDILRLEIVGQTYTAKINGGVVATGTLPHAITGGAPGVYVTGTPYYGRLDNWMGGTIISTNEAPTSTRRRRAMTTD